MTPPERTDHPRALTWLAWIPLGIALVVVPATGFVQVALCAPAFPTMLDMWGWLPTIFSTFGFAVLCGLIITRQPQNRIGWLCGAIAALGLPFLGPASILLPCHEQGLIPLPGKPYLALLTNLSVIVISLQFLLLPLWYPDGRFLSAGWRRFALVTYGLLALGTLLLVVWPGNMLNYEMVSRRPFDNPFGLPFQPSPDLTLLVQRFPLMTLLGGILIANFSLFARWRRSDRVTKQQIKVFAFYLVTIGTVFMLFQLTGTLLSPVYDLLNLWDGWLYMALNILLWVGYPFAIGVSVLKYRLYDIDVVIRKTLVYAGLSLTLTLVYFCSVVLLQNLLAAVSSTALRPGSGQPSAIATVISTLVIAALFTPLRRRIQRDIDRRFYRKKYDAEKTVAAFASTAREATDLDTLSATLVRVVEETMQPESVSLWMRKVKE